MDIHDRKARRAKFTLVAIGVAAGGALVAGIGTALSVTMGKDDSPPPAAPGPSATAKPSPGSSGKEWLRNPDMTPEKAKGVTLDVPTGQKNGAATGFPHNLKGSLSAAVYFWEEYAFLDDQKARQQLQVVTSPDATGYIDQQISEVRKLREGVGLPPSGPAPAGITFTTAVNAVRPTSIILPGEKRGDVVQVWMNYDRYGIEAGGGTDDNPLKGETVDLILKWQDGGWKITNEPKYWAERSFPVAYFPESTYAWQDGWMQARHAD